VCPFVRPAFLLALPATAAVLTAALVPVTLVLARRLGAMDQPGNRKIHTRPVGRLGGIAPALVFWATAMFGFIGLREPVLRDFVGDGLQDFQAVGPKLFGVLLGSFIAFATGLTDDLFGVRFPFWAKALGQISAALCVVIGGVTTTFLPYPWLNWILTVFWLVGITNAFNLLDNMDGLSSGVAMIASSVLLVNALGSGENLIAAMALAFIGVLLGFLRYNFNPASVFLGDCGSHFVGFVLASILLLDRYATSASSSLFPVLMPVLLLAVPIIDTTTVVIIRLREGRPIYVGDARHLSHTLVARGFSQKNAVLLIYLMTLGLGLAALPLRNASLAETGIILLQSSCFIAVILFLMFSGSKPEVKS
jgi:UDP-GlcNAc:undecaprenyl-phosphate/decaprenyl-phosphate GlcNAc-1-phosphate transferase